MQFEVNMPVGNPGYQRNRFYRWGMFLEKFQRNAHTDAAGPGASG
jgi:hypothetical protein